jgi:hypothetical protein
MFVGWLWKSDRLDGGRVDAIREMLSMTISEAEALADPAAVEGAGAGSLAEPMASTSGRSSELQVELISMRRGQEALGQQGLLDERARLARLLDLRETELARDRETLAQERQAWEAAIEAQRAQELDEQFARTVKIYESLPGKQGKKMLLELVAAGSPDQAVAYLNAMNSRAASRILREFKTEAETKLATELLEKLSTYGFEAVVPEEPSDERAPADNA